jgi:ABC-type taurine transport system ATPase subunit
VAFGPRSRRLPERLIRRQVGEILELVRLSELARRRPYRLSGRQQQRVALARSPQGQDWWVSVRLALPLTKPEIVLAVVVYNLLVGIDLPRTPLTLLLSHSLFCLTYAALTRKARLANCDRGLELAAQNPGAPPLEEAELFALV